MAKRKKQTNFFVAYFKNFGIRQLCDILMIAGAIVLFIGLFTTDLVVSIGLGIYIVAAGLAIFRSAKVLLKTENKRAPEFKAARVNVIVMSLILALAIFGLVYSIIY